MEGHTQSLIKIIWMHLILIPLCIFLANRIISDQRYTPSAAPSIHDLACEEDIEFMTVYERDKNSLVTQSGRFSFFNDAWMERNICKPGELHLSAHGTSAQNEPPELRVMLNSEIIFQDNFSDRRTVYIPVEKTGKLGIAFLNDYYRSEARVAWIDLIKFEGRECHSFYVKVSEESSEKTLAQKQVFTIANATRVTISPCGEGVMSLRYFGQEAAGQFPELGIRGGTMPPVEVTATSSRNQISFVTSKEPVTIFMLNPYSREIEDRNLFIDKISFHEYER